MYRLGKLPVNPDHVKKALKFADYVPAVLPPIPGSFSNLSNVFASLGMQNTSSNIPVLFPLDGNGPDPSVPTTTGYGDCVMAMLLTGLRFAAACWASRTFRPRSRWSPRT